MSLHSVRQNMTGEFKNNIMRDNDSLKRFRYGQEAD